MREASKTASREWCNPWPWSSSSQKNWPRPLFKSYPWSSNLLPSRVGQWDLIALAWPLTLSLCPAQETVFALTIQRSASCRFHLCHRTNGRESTTDLFLGHFSFRSKFNKKAIITQGALQLFSHRFLFVIAVKFLFVFVPTLPWLLPPAPLIALAIIIIIMSLSIMRRARSQRKEWLSL